jgi:hypothetical protein
MTEMTSKLDELYKLQQIDNQILQNMRRIRQIDKVEHPVQKKHRELNAKLEAFDKEQIPFKAKAKELQDQIAVYKDKKNNVDMKLDDSQTDPKELQFIFKEREQYTKLIKTAEDEIVKLMLELGNIDLKKRGFVEHLNEIEEEFKKVTDERAADKERFAAEVEKLRNERKAFKNFSDKTLLSHYQELQKTHDGMAIATIEDTDDKDVKVCTGCNVEVSLRTLQALERADGLVYCQRCGRILYRQG